MNPTLDRYRYWVAAAVAGLTVALAILLRGFVREFVVIPIVQFLWLINLYLRGIPQPLCGAFSWRWPPMWP